MSSFVGLTKKPCPLINSLQPPTSVNTKGNFALIASIADIGKPSSNEGRTKRLLFACDSGMLSLG